MKTTLLLLLCAACYLACLAGCQRQNSDGNYLGESSLGLVNDAATRIAALYPPASTRFAIAVEPDESDMLGLDLVGKLREAGYAVHEAGAGPHGVSLIGANMNKKHKFALTPLNMARFCV